MLVAGVIVRAEERAAKLLLKLADQHIQALSEAIQAYIEREVWAQLAALSGHVERYRARGARRNRPRCAALLCGHVAGQDGFCDDHAGMPEKKKEEYRKVKKRLAGGGLTSVS